MTHIKLFNHYIHLPYFYLGLLEFGLLILSVFVATYCAFGPSSFVEFYFGSDLSDRALVYALVMMSSTVAMGVYDAQAREGFSGMAIRTLASYCLLGASALTILFYVFPVLYLGKSVMVVSIIFSLFLVILVRTAFYALVDVDSLRRRILVYGSGERAAELLSALIREHQNLALDIVGCVREGQINGDIPEKYLMDPPSDWLAFINSNKVSEIVIAADERRRGEGALFPMEELVDCKMRGVRVIEAIDFYEREFGLVQLEHLNPGWMLFSSGFRYSQGRDIAKRCFDLLVASVIFLLAWPFMLLTALAVWLEDGSPMLYSQVRVGLNGSEFRVYKFRSMGNDAEKDGKAVWAKQNDARVTKVGAVIRNTRLDELPQLYNVFTGDMSFVGPRPERPEFVEDLSKEIPYFESRSRVKPGLMGWAQLKYPYGASVKDAEEKLRYDLYYVKNHSLLLDALIVVQTVEVILLGKGVR